MKSQDVDHHAHGDGACDCYPIFLKFDLALPPYHPAMMVALLLYSYAVGLYSSRRIAKACMERVDFMAIVALQAPDFRTIIGASGRYWG